MSVDSKMFFIILVVVVLFFSGCDNNKKIKSINNNSIVLAFGDSLTAGTGAAKEESYPAVLGRIIGCRVINEGVPGEVSADGVERLPELLLKYTPDLVIICYGGNDFLRKNNESEIFLNLEKMIRLVEATDADIILIGVPKPGLLLRTHKLYKKLSDKYKIPLQFDVIRNVLTSPGMKSDYVHPNNSGYKEIAIKIADLINESSN